MKTIEIIVSPSGESRLETKGFVGDECESASKPIEEALGLRTQSRRTSEFFRTECAECRLGQAGAEA